MKKYYLPMIIALLLLTSGCAIGGLVEADQLDGTWVSDDFYTTNSQPYYVYYDFRSLSVDLDGDQRGRYRICAYRDTFWWDTNYQLLEEGDYTTDYLRGIITIIPYSGESRILHYTLSDNFLVFTDTHWWTANYISLRKL
ncbi:MAG: hypothetical protein JEY91_04390 [Spirochaetaceae bacterium]|nr:hypothetical protein [Spirochaetaceae bacterium]